VEDRGDVTEKDADLQVFYWNFHASSTGVDTAGCPVRQHDVTLSGAGTLTNRRPLRPVVDNFFEEPLSILRARGRPAAIDLSER
jgi:hypothetical protein